MRIAGMLVAVAVVGCGARSHLVVGGDDDDDGADGCGRCTVEPETGRTSGCSPRQFGVETADGMAVVHVDADGCGEVEVAIQTCDPEDWVLNIGDSISNNGGGGDGSHFSNDAELQILGSTLTVFGNDYAGDERVLRVVTSFVAEHGCTDRTITIRDGFIDTDVYDTTVESDYAIRFDQPDDEGEPDSIIHVGMNRVVESAGRAGTGLQTATITTR